MLSALAFVTAWIRSRDDERGASLVEYGFLLCLIAVVCMIALDFLGHEASTSFADTATSLQNPN